MKKPVVITPKKWPHVPQEVIDQARQMARTRMLKDVAAALGMHPSQISRMRKNGWRATDYSCKLRKRPRDFVARQKTMSHEQLVEHYQAGDRTVCRWRKEIGDKARPTMRGEALRRDSGKRSPKSDAGTKRVDRIPNAQRERAKEQRAREKAEQGLSKFERQLKALREGRASICAPLPKVYTGTAAP